MDSVWIAGKRFLSTHVRRSSRYKHLVKEFFTLRQVLQVRFQCLITQNSHFQKKVSLEEQKAQKEDRFLRGRQVAFMIYDYFRVTGAHVTVLDYSDLVSVFQEFETRWDEVLFTINVKDALRQYLGKSIQIENTWVCATPNRIGIVRHGDSSEDIDAQVSKVEDNGQEEYKSETSIKKFWRQAWENWIWRRKRYLLPVERKRQVFEGRPVQFLAWEYRSCKTDTKSRHTFWAILVTRSKCVEEKSSIRGKSNHGAILRQPCRYCLKGTCTRWLCDYWHPPECQFCKTESGCKAGDKCLFPNHKVDEQPNKSPNRAAIPTKKEKAKTKVLQLLRKTVPQLGCVSQDSDALVSQRGKRFRGNPVQKVLGSIRKVIGKIQVKPQHQRSPYATKTRGSVPWGDWKTTAICARSKAWNLAKNINKLKANDKATFFSPAEKWVLPSASAREPEEREFVVDSGASMHMVSEKDMNSAELETMRTSRSPTTVMTANGEVQTREEATVYVKTLDLFVKDMLLEKTPAVSFSRKALRWSCVFLPLDQRSKTTYHQKWQENQLQ